MGRSCINVIRIRSLVWALKLVKYGLYNMQDYLTDEFQDMSFYRVAGILNVVQGFSLVLEVFLLFLVEQPRPGYKTMILISSIAIGLGMGIITMSTLTGTTVLKSMAMAAHKRHVLYTGMILVAIGRAGYSVFIHLLIEQQKDQSDENNSERDCCRKIMRKLIQLVFAALGSITPRVGAVALAVFINKPYLNFGIPALAIVFATLIFLSGWQDYSSVTGTHSRGSPLTNVCRVLVASVRKRLEPSTKLQHRDNLYLGADQDSPEFTKTSCLGCLHKAAIKVEKGCSMEGQDKNKNKWKLCSVAEVEEAKVIFRMIPISMTFLVWGIVSSVGETYFMEQVTDDGEIVMLCYAMAEVSFGKLAEWVLKKHRNISAAPSIGIAVAMVLSVLCCAASAKVENWRRTYYLALGNPNHRIDKKCVHWFIFQFSVLGSLDGIFDRSIAAFYNQEAPDSMKKYADHFTNGAAGVGFMCSMLNVYTVRRISKIGSSKHSWFKHTLDESRLDKYYWVLAGLSLLSLAVFVVLAACYRYNKPVDKAEDHPSPPLPLD